MIFENKPQIGIGSFTVKEIAELLNVDYQTVHRWLKVYWDGKLSEEYGENYSWVTNGKRAVSFHTFVEFYVMMQLSEAGVRPKEVLLAHKELSSRYNSPFPFALKDVLLNIKTDGKQVFFHEKKEVIITLDGTKQLNLNLIQLFYASLEFDSQDLASRFYPLGKEKSILIDPKRKFGRPVFKQSNTFPEVIYQHYLAGDSKEYLAAVYELSDNEVHDAITFCERSHAA